MLKQSGPLWTWRLELEIWQYVIALSMKIYCTDQCLVHCQYLDRLINHYPISMMYGSIAQQITKMVCVIAWLKGSCCTCSKWLFAHEHILWCLTISLCIKGNCFAHSQVYLQICQISIWHLRWDITSWPANKSSQGHVCIILSHSELIMNMASSMNVALARSLWALYIDKCMSNLYTILLMEIESVVYTCWKKVSCAFGFDVMMM